MWEEMVGLMHILACVDAMERSHDRSKWASQSPCFPPLTEPQALQAALQHGNTLAECKHQVTHSGILNSAW